MTSIVEISKFGFDLADNSLLYVKKPIHKNIIEIVSTLGTNVRSYPDTESRDNDYKDLLSTLQAGGIPCFDIIGYGINSNSVSKLFRVDKVCFIIFTNGYQLEIACGSVEIAKNALLFIKEHATASGGVSPEIQEALDKKADKSDTYTKEEVNEIAASINSFEVKVVDQLPTEDIDTHTIYFVPKIGESTEVDGYDEYLYIGGKWEYLGNTIIDLSDYATVKQLNKVASDVDYIGNTVIPEMNTNTAKALDTKVDWDSTKTVISLPKNGSISALRNEATLEGGNLLAQRTYDDGATYVTEVGTVKNKLTLNGSERPQVDLAGGTSEKIAYESEVIEVKEDLDDIIPIFVQIPIRTLKDEVYDKATILGWFGVEDDATLKGYISRQHPMFLKYGISLSYNPHYYKFPVEYIAYETANQIKMVFSGLNTKDDVVSKYQIILNLDGKLIENTQSNVGLTIISLEEGVESYNELTDRPQINGITLEGNKSLKDLGIQASGQEIAADLVTYTNGSITNVQEALDELLYVAPVITSFTGGGTYEMGSTVSQVVLNWAINKAVKTQNLNNGIGDISAELRTYTIDKDITTNTTYTLTVNDGKQTTSKSTSITFRQKRYWGVSVDESLTNEQILSMSSEFATNRQQSRVFDCSGGKYFYFIIPTQFCNGISFKVGGLAFSDMQQTTIELTNASNYKASYNVYRVGNIQTGSAINVEVL